jgi:hypothetical protein
MSGFPINLSLSILSDLVNLVLFQPRNIGGFIADVTIEEHHRDSLAITEHPIEQGAAIADHSFLRPAHVTIRAGWSNSSVTSARRLATAFQTQSLSPIFDTNYIRTVYGQLRDLQATREPFDVVTGKRSYSNMLMENLLVHTDERSENALMVTCDCREVILVGTSTISIPNASSQQTPQLNQPTIDNGQKQLTPATNFNPAAAEP